MTERLRHPDVVGEVRRKDEVRVSPTQYDGEWVASAAGHGAVGATPAEAIARLRSQVEPMESVESFVVDEAALAAVPPWTPPVPPTDQDR